MNYIIDGHNLIPKIKDLSLDMPDDEQRLMELLVGYCLAGGHRVEVFFDGAPAGQTGVRSFGRLRAHFVPERQTADDAIRTKLARLGKSARNWLVVTSDRSVQNAAHEAHTQVLGSEEFALRLRAAPQPITAGVPPAQDEPLSEAEIKEWEAIFKGKNRRKQF